MENKNTVRNILKLATVFMFVFFHYSPAQNLRLEYDFLLKRIKEKDFTGFPYPVKETVKSQTRTIFMGKIKDIKLAEDNNPQKLQGLITIVKEDGSSQTFFVRTYTFIMIVSLTGYGYAGTLKQLKPGWKCELAFDVPPGDDWNIDSVSRDLNDEFKYADNMIVYYQK